VISKAPSEAPTPEMPVFAAQSRAVALPAGSPAFPGQSGAGLGTARGPAGLSGLPVPSGAAHRTGTGTVATCSRGGKHAVGRGRLLSNQLLCGISSKCSQQDSAQSQLNELRNTKGKLLILLNKTAKLPFFTCDFFSHLKCYQNISINFIPTDSSQQLVGLDCQGKLI